jgi:hypothetical protein
MRKRAERRQSSGPSLMIEAPWLLPTQNVTGVVELSTNTRRILVNLGPPARLRVELADVLFAEVGVPRKPRQRPRSVRSMHC